MVAFASLAQVYDYDKKLAEKGAEMFIAMNANGNETIMIVGRGGNPKHEAVQRSRSDELERARYSVEKRKQIITEIVVDGLLFDWRGVLDENGNEVPSTRENKISALKQFEDLATEIMTFANDNNNYQTKGEKALGVDSIEESEKN